MACSKCTLTNSVGLLESCDFHPANHFVSLSRMLTYPSVSQLINMVKARQIENKVVSIGVVGSALRFFIRKFLPKLRFKFVLLVNGSDYTFPYSQFPSRVDFERFIDDCRIVRVFVQNCAVKHPKITPIPIGLDFHTLSVKTTAWGEQQHPSAQEYTLLAIKLRALQKPFWQRKPVAYANFHFFFGLGHGQDRRDAMQQMDSACVYYEPKKVPRLASWNKQTEFAFVISPHGNGLDCHRTWEAINLGCIVIVKTSPLDSLYADLPVLIVKHWSEVTPQRLSSCLAEFQNREFKLDILSLSYWKNALLLAQTLQPTI